MRNWQAGARPGLGKAGQSDAAAGFYPVVRGLEPGQIQVWLDTVPAGCSAMASTCNGRRRVVLGVLAVSWALCTSRTGRGHHRLSGTLLNPVQATQLIGAGL